MSGGYAYIANSDSGLRIISVGNPQNPHGVGSCATPDFDIGIAVSGHYAYVGSGSAGLRIINVSNP